MTRALLPLAIMVLSLLPALAAGQTGGQRAAPYTLQNLVDLVKSQWPSVTILSWVSESCIAFAMNDAAAATLTTAGADTALLQGLRAACVVRAPTAPPPPPSHGIVWIEGFLPPGWHRTVNGGFVNTNRTIELTPGRTGLIVVTAPGWCPDRMEITMEAGQRHTWTPALRAKPWVGGCEGE